MYFRASEVGGACALSGIDWWVKAVLNRPSIRYERNALTDYAIDPLCDEPTRI